VTAERGYGKTYGLAEDAKAEQEIIRAQPLFHSPITLILFIIVYFICYLFKIIRKKSNIIYG
jgi:hypothetical protein